MTLGNFRLLLGAEPRTGEQVGLRPDAGVVRGLIRKDLEELPFNLCGLIPRSLLRYTGWYEPIYP